MKLIVMNANPLSAKKMPVELRSQMSGHECLRYNNTTSSFTSTPLLFIHISSLLNQVIVVLMTLSSSIQSISIKEFP